MNCILGISVREDMPWFLSLIGGEMGSVGDVTVTTALYLVAVEVRLDMSEIAKCTSICLLDEGLRHIPGVTESGRMT